MPGDHGLVGEELERLLTRQVEHVGDVLPLERDVEGVAVVPGPLAHLAGHVDVRQEVHLDLDGAVTGTGLASPAGDVEGEPSRLVAPDPCLLRLAEELADGVEHPRVGGRVGPRRAPDRRLVHVDDLVDRFGALDRAVAAGDDLGVVDALHEAAVEDVVHQRRLAGAGHAGHRDEAAQGQLHVEVLQVVLTGIPDDDPVLARLAPHLGHRDRQLTRDVAAGQRPLGGFELSQRPRAHDLPPVLTGARTDVDDVVGDPDGLFVVLDHDDRVPEVAQAQEGVDELAVVPLVQPDGGLVQNVQDTDQTAADLAGETDPLGLASGQGAGGAVEAQVVEANVEQELDPSLDLS